MRKNGFCATLLTIVLLTTLTACGQARNVAAPDYTAEAEAAISYCVSEDDCFLCGGGIDHVYWECLGQNNVGILSLNTFDLVPVEINQYDNYGELIEGNVGYTKTFNYRGEDGGFSSYITASPDRGTASAQISFNDDKLLQLKETASHLCEEHFKEFTEDVYGNPFGVGIVSFEKAKIYPLKESTSGLQVADYSIHFDIKRNDKQEIDGMSLYIAFTPLRYNNKA